MNYDVGEDMVGCCKECIDFYCEYEEWNGCWFLVKMGGGEEF